MGPINDPWLEGPEAEAEAKTKLRDWEDRPMSYRERSCDVLGRKLPGVGHGGAKHDPGGGGGGMDCDGREPTLSVNSLPIHGHAFDTGKLNYTPSTVTKDATVSVSIGTAAPTTGGGLLGGQTASQYIQEQEAKRRAVLSQKGNRYLSPQGSNPDPIRKLALELAVTAVAQFGGSEEIVIAAKNYENYLRGVDIRDEPA